MGEGESLYGGLDRPAVDAAQPVLQLQKLLPRGEQEGGGGICLLDCHSSHIHKDPEASGMSRGGQERKTNNCGNEKRINLKDAELGEAKVCNFK